MQNRLYWILICNTDCSGECMLVVVDVVAPLAMASSFWQRLLPELPRKDLVCSIVVAECPPPSRMAERLHTRSVPKNRRTAERLHTRVPFERKNRRTAERQKIVVQNGRTTKNRLERRNRRTAECKYFFISFGELTRNSGELARQSGSAVFVARNSG